MPTTTVQYFKGDEIELKVFDAINPVITNLEADKDAFFVDAYNCYKLGEVLYDSGAAPLANAIPREIFREAFAAIFNSFLVAGGLESYLTVFRAVFGADVEVTFTMPGPGKLEIDIVATGTQIFGILGREIVDDAYVLSTLIDDEGDRIVGRGFKGFETQYELEQMLFEMVPGGIYTVISLTIGS